MCSPGFPWVDATERGNLPTTQEQQKTDKNTTTIAIWVRLGDAGMWLEHAQRTIQ